MRSASSILLALAGSACAAVPRERSTADGPGTAGGFAVEPLASGVQASLRGLHVVDDRVAWASGSEGHVGVTTDGGGHWTFRRVAGHEDRDFRDVEGFSAERALVMAVASPGLILETADGGATWTERFRDDRPEVFLDAIECVETRSPVDVEPSSRSEASSSTVAFDAAGRTTCLAFGDPIAGRFLLVRSMDGGRSWTEIEGPEAIPGEAAFAASGTALRFRRRNRSETGADSGAAAEVAIGTGGGASARVLTSIDLGRSWRAEPVPLASGAASRGVFSLVESDAIGWVAVGGDHLAENESTGTAAIQLLGRSPPSGEPTRQADALHWVRPATLPAGYRSAVERLGDGRFIATGPSGTDLSVDLARNWQAIATDGFHAVRSSPSGDVVLLAGAGGRIARLVTRSR